MIKYTPQGLQVEGPWPANYLLTLDEAYASIRAQLPFLGGVMYNLKHVYGVDPEGTAGTDCHSTIWWCSGLFARFEPHLDYVANVARVATHELLHVVRGDSFFMAEFMAGEAKAGRPEDRSRMNIALDYFVNTYLTDTLGVRPLTLAVAWELRSVAELAGREPVSTSSKLPWRKLSPDHAGYTVAGLYNALFKDGAPQTQGSGPLHVPAAGAPKAGSKALEDAKQQHQKLLAKAAAQASAPGQPALGAGEQHLIGTYVTPDARDATPIDWKRRLKAKAGAAIRRGGRSEYTRQGRPSIRGFDAPTQRQVSLPNRLVGEYPLSLVVAVDTSGSIDRALFGVFVANLREIRRAYPDSPLDIIYCDSQVQKHVALREGQPVPGSVPHGGGTAFAPVFDYVKRKGLKPSVLVYFTDLDASYPREVPPYPVLWVAYNTKDKAPFGETIHA